MREKITGDWFHTLKNIDNKTLLALFDKFKASFNRFKTEDVVFPIIFCFCVLDLNWAFMKVFNPVGKQLKLYVDEFFRLDYSVKQGEIFIETGNENGWVIIK